MGDSSAVETEKFVVSLPDFSVKEDIDSFIATLIAHTNVHGVKRLLSRVEKYQMHMKLADNLFEGIHSTTNYINNVRSKDQKKGDNKRSIRSKAEAFYNTLSTPILRMQCTAFDLYYDSFETVEDVITALVDKTVENINN